MHCIVGVSVSKRRHYNFSPISLSLRFANLSCLSLAVSATRRGFTCSLLRCSLSSLSSDGFRAHLEVFGISMFSTGNKTRFAHVRSHAFCPHMACIRMHWTYDVKYIYMYIYIYIYIYRERERERERNSAVKLTSVGLAHACPNN